MMINQEFKSVLKEIDQSNGLPNRNYTDNIQYNIEKKLLIFDQWAGVAVSEDIPNVGDAIPITFVGVPLLLLRNEKRELKVFLNVCRHRGMILINKPKNVSGAIRCPYHSWCYSKNGNLISTPHVGGPGKNIHKGINKEKLGLLEIKSHIWQNIIWININGNAPAFENYMTDAMKRWSDFNQEQFHGGEDSKFQLKVKCNWKLAVENYCESYHLPWVHPDLNSYSRLQDHYNIENPGFYSGQGTLLYKQIKGPKNVKFPNFKNLSEKWKKSAEYLAIYPNVLLGVHKDHTYSIILIPKGPNKTIEKVDIYYSKKITDTNLRKRNTKQWKKVFKEDISVVEGMQKGRKGIHFDGGKFSPVMDGPTHCFHKWVASNLLIKENNLHEKQ